MGLVHEARKLNDQRPFRWTTQELTSLYILRKDFGHVRSILGFECAGSNNTELQARQMS